MTLAIQLQHRFRDFRLDIDVQAPPGLTVLFGPSGSGKTTIINTVAGLLRPDHGRIVVNGWALLDSASGHILPPHRRRLGYVFQDARLFPHLSVRQNLLYGRWFARLSARDHELEQVVDMLGIGHLLSRRPGSLSGGEKSRVALGRALLASPRLILADEPMAALDEARKAEILPFFERLRDESRVPILYVSHSGSEVARLATTVIALREGRVTAVGPPDVVLGDAEAMGQDTASLLCASIAAHHDDGLTQLVTPAGYLWVARLGDPPGTPIRVRVAARDVMLSHQAPQGLSALNVLSGTIIDMQLEAGPSAQVTLRVGTDRLVARLTRRSVGQLGLAPGQRCHAILKTVAVAPGDIRTAPLTPG
ncbi:MAG: molybdenum ABC transporter ATP-binding protein [Alphaproteobacteria bacterium]|nr:molybdenum ABC transporter ATP-binding protein [Alphaproteobacteria bacterium]